MKLLTILLGVIFTIASPLFVQCSINPWQKSELPKEMPAETEMNYSENGGMAPYYKTIKISGNLLFVEEKTMQKRIPQSWSAEISDEDKNALYQIFVENKFDKIKNDEREGIVYDAPSSGIYIRAGKKSFHASSGANSPLSGFNLKSWQNVKSAIFKLEANYKDKAVQTNQNYTFIKYDPEEYNFIFKDAKNAELSGIEIAKLNKLTGKAIDEHNSINDKAEKINDIKEYKFQFIAVYKNNNEKEVWVNAFCKDLNKDWKTQLIMAKDGGSCFFNLMINLTTSTNYDFQVNGAA